MSSEKGNVSRSRAQKYKNTTAFKNDKYGATAQVKRAKSKIHDGLCQHCKDVLDWKVKYNKYKPLTQPRKCVKCSQKTVKDAYHIICKPCCLQLEICCKCGKTEDAVIPVNVQAEKTQQEEDGHQKKKGQGQQDSTDDLDSDDDEEEDDFDCDSGPKKTHKTSAVLPDVSSVNIKD
ncbi:uncharacterized protein C9orf85 homolog [Thalassophryne amazonica]|uniref:uncharacterized protein C9orf85 homolog n=1 Tax=Thalassophryne amazonica TaxID=390379 RepID=UPI001470D9AA|nr:uncharacterized protein C9orf85 homolog [Thalassophryne amazonica]